MDISELAEKLRSELTCSICLDLFTQAVTLECGHNFCRECILQSWQQALVPRLCPLCKTRSGPRGLKPTWALEGLVSIMRQPRPPGPREMGGQATCGQHAAMHKLFCEDDHLPLCASCVLSQEHKAHQVYPLEESAQTCRGQLQEALGSAWAREREAHVLLEQERGRRLRCRMEGLLLKRLILPQYLKTQPAWKQGKQQDLLDRQNRRNAKRLRASEASISSYIQSLRKLTEELQKTLEQPLLQMLLGGRSPLQRSRELLLSCPQPAALSWTVCGTSGMRELLLAFQSHISLDPGTAYSHLILSADLKSVSLASNWWELLANPQGATDYPFSVLGAQSFTSGTHYWEVEVVSQTEWEVGLWAGPGDGQGDIQGDALSLACLKTGDQFSLWISHTTEEPEQTGPLHRLGIFLHYEAGHVSFYNVTQGCLIYAFPPLTFQGPLRPLFSLGVLQEDNQPSALTISPLSPQS
ncbi:probable E3 ubiquitin-protein ligase TRIML1 [Gracilinanus agilis]|uniref:probable E3 ubiquitin-protein ligase TRIML1 n=1 Tax=Gracilinanus agilis TaxID=191870 RepID=UPI001CFF284A|nr:probable E3 ubiquitin-protein ligase TRIML1 [Gracilinanus agilis]